MWQPTNIKSLFFSLDSWSSNCWFCGLSLCYRKLCLHIWNFSTSKYSFHIIDNKRFNTINTTKTFKVSLLQRFPSVTNSIRLDIFAPSQSACNTSLYNYLWNKLFWTLVIWNRIKFERHRNIVDFILNYCQLPFWWYYIFWALWRGWITELLAKSYSNFCFTVQKILISFYAPLNVVKNFVQIFVIFVLHRNRISIWLLLPNYSARR